MAKDQALKIKEDETSTALVVQDFGDEAGGGLENLSPDEYRIPFLRVLDPKSPQCRPLAQGGIPGAKAGAIFNVATKEVFDGEIGIDFVPAARDHNFVRYLKRNDDGSGGGFEGLIAPEDPMIHTLRKEQGKFGKLRPDEEHEITETYYLYGVAIPPNGEPFWCVVGFASTQIKHYNTFITRAMNFKYPQSDGTKKTAALWVHRWHFSTAYEQKGAMGWYGWKIGLAKKKADGSDADYRESMLAPDDGFRASAKSLYETFREGKARADMSAAQAEPFPDSDEVPL